MPVYNIVDLELDDSGDLYAVGNFTGKIKFSNRTLNARSGTDVFLLKIGSDGLLKEFSSLPIMEDQKVASMAIGDEKIFICGTFTGNLVFGEHEVQSFGKSDGFVAQLDKRDLSDFDWISSFGGVGYDYCNDIDWFNGSLAVVGDYSSDINLLGNDIQLNESLGSFCAKFSEDGDLIKYYIFESAGILTAKQVSYDQVSESFLILGEFSKEVSAKDSFITSSFRGLCCKNRQILTSCKTY